MLRRSLSCGSMTYDHDKKSNFAVLNQSNLDVTSTKYSIKSWFLADVNDKIAKQKLPLQSFNHISREVICLQKSLRFYVDILGFIAVPRPPFEVEGVWLWGYGLSLHLILTTRKQERLDLLRKRLEHFSDCLPSVDHIAFVTDDLSRIEKLLDEANCYYKKTSSEAVGINQIFFFDPDGNVIELSDCGIPTGMTTCPHFCKIDEEMTVSITSSGASSPQKILEIDCD